MGFMSSLDICSSALTAQRMRMDVIAENLANINTTRDANGEPYRRRYVTMQAKDSFSGYMNTAMSSDTSVTSTGGVRVTSILEDDSPFSLDYNPEHPDADENGYVSMPNVDLTREMVDMMSATRSYEASITAINAIKNMATQALNIGK